MNKEFKTLLLKIARLPLVDQRWILNQLTPKQQEQFSCWQGESLLLKARQFRKVAYDQANAVPQIKPLPDFCKELRQQAPLYIAILLDQGQFEWEQPFVQTIEQRNEIKQLMEETVPFIKPETKACIYKQWQAQLNFIDQLECLNG
jgi:hypothetical protein